MQDDAARPAATPESGIVGGVPPAVAQRAGDADRERAVGRLRDAAIAGKLTLEEFSERVERALQARSQAELQDLGADLGGVPVLRSPESPPEARWVAMSRLERRGPWQLAAASRLNVLCGTVVLDLGQAAIHDATTTLHIHNLFSTVTIMVPDAVNVEIDDGGAFLTTEVALPQRRATAGAPTIRIRLSGACGTNHIRTVPAATPPAEAGA